MALDAARSINRPGWWTAAQQAKQYSGLGASRSFREDKDDRWEQIGYAVKT